MGHNIFKEGFQGSRGSGRGPRYAAANTESIEAAVSALSAKYLATMENSAGTDEDTLFSYWMMDSIAEALAAKIPADADGQQVLDGVICAIRRKRQRMPARDSSYDTLYLGRVIQGLYLAGHNNLFLELADIPSSGSDELTYLHGTADKKLVLSVQGSFDTFEMMDHCRISHSGKVNCIKNCSDSRFDIHGTECPWIETRVRDCTFYFHDIGRESIRLEEQSLLNTYFVRDDKGRWERVWWEGVWV